MLPFVNCRFELTHGVQLSIGRRLAGLFRGILCAAKSDCNLHRGGFFRKLMMQSVFGLVRVKRLDAFARKVAGFIGLRRFLVFIVFCIWEKILETRPQNNLQELCTMWESKSCNRFSWNFWKTIFICWREIGWVNNILAIFRWNKVFEVNLYWMVSVGEHKFWSLIYTIPNRLRNQLKYKDKQSSDRLYDKYYKLWSLIYFEREKKSLNYLLLFFVKCFENNARK